MTIAFLQESIKKILLQCNLFDKTAIITNIYYCMFELHLSNTINAFKYVLILLLDFAINLN